MTWLAIAALAAGTYGLRVAGPLLRTRLRIPDGVQRYLSLSAVTLLAALIATAALFAGSAFAGWARPAGVLAGALCAWRRLPFVVVVIAAAGTTALLRLAGLD
jgi:branched-subunit amino acid transport protein